MRLELLQETFLMVVWVSPVVLLCSVPVLFKRRQYLQSFLGQNGNPLFLILPQCWVVGWGILVLVLDVGMLVGGVFVTKSSKPQNPKQYTSHLKS